jgi:DNA-binding NarL/FixJ family response regulator
VSEATIRVLCVDDHAVVRDGLTMIIDVQSDMEVVATASSAEEAFDLYPRFTPDVVLMDLEMPGMGGVEGIRTIRSQYPSARIIVLTVHSRNEDIFRALEAGAAAYLLKDMLTKDLIGVIRQVHLGERPIRPEIAARLNERASQAALTSREVGVLQLIARGMTNREIASALAISEQTVHAHTRNIFGKLKVSDRIAAVTVASRRGIVHLE